MNTPKLDGICVLVDGGCLNNNKPVSDREMYFSLKVYHNGKPVKSTWAQISAIQHRLTIAVRPEMGDQINNQVAELLAMEAALSYATSLRDRMQGTSTPLTAITILQDSEYGLGWGSGSYKGNSKTSDFVRTEATQCASLRRYLKEKLVEVTYQHVPEAWVKTQLGH
jgi:ribonuclease HI